MVKKQQFDMLQIFRGIACLLVVFHHAYSNFEYFIGKLNLPIIKFISLNGKYGVDFFFVLSGFIITYTTYKYKNDRTYFKTYLLNRILKIYVPYLPLSFIALFVYKFTDIANVDRPISIISSLTLFPHGETALIVAWTLVFEVFFYIIFSVNFFSSKIWNFFVFFWVIGIIFFNYMEIKQDNVFFNLIFSPYNLEFILGFIISVLIRKGFKINALLAICVSLAYLSVFLWLRINQYEFFKFSSHLIIAIFCSILVYIFVSIFNYKISKKNLLMLVGNSSYSLYLIHTIFFAIMLRLLPASNDRIISVVVFFSLIAFCCIISYLYYLIFEKKSCRFTKIKILQRKIIFEREKQAYDLLFGIYIL